MMNVIRKLLIYADIVKACKSQVDETRGIFRAIGCSGQSGFEDLPYCRCVAVQPPCVLILPLSHHPPPPRIPGSKHLLARVTCRIEKQVSL
jgi:hypothetical protein